MLVQAATEMTLGNDPDLAYTPSGKAVCKVRAVTSRRFKRDDGEWEDRDTTWYELTAWGPLAENMAESLTSGMKVIVLGKVYNEEWEDRDGNKRLSLKIRVDAIGPSLAFATAQVKKTERSGAGSHGGTSRSFSPPADDPWSQPPANNDEPPF